MSSKLNRRRRPECSHTGVSTTAGATTGVTGLSPSRSRIQAFAYDWATNPTLQGELTLARARYESFLGAYLNCDFHTVCASGGRGMGAFTRVDTAPQLEEHVGALASSVVDNLIRVTNSGIVEMETRYDSSLFSTHFDKASRQRWGSSYATPSAPDSAFLTTLPEAQFAYAEVHPSADGTTDGTANFIGSLIAARYPLEPAQWADFARLSAQSKGMLLPANSPAGAVIPGRLAAIAEGSIVPTTPQSTVKRCELGQLPVLRSGIAGYAPSLDYFDSALPTATNPEAPTVGVDLNAQLKRSRVSCEMLASAQAWDARHNDLQWTWAKQTSGDYVSTRILGRRQHMNANANRICGWSRVTDRDGDVHTYGLNYQGRVLVDAVQVAGQWKFAETLYNADGNVISQRRTMSQAANWTPTAGDTRYSYMEPVVSGSTQTAALPAYWARRGNVARVIQTPRSGTVLDEVEGTPGTTQSSKGRYALYDYEPLYNQVRKVVSGSRNASGGLVPTLITTVLFDYQEKPLAQLTPVLQHLQAFGFAFPVDAQGQLILTGLEARLGVTFNLGDVNGDGALGGTVSGLPVQVVNEAPAPLTQREFSLYRWSPSARPYFVQRPDGSVDSMLYLAAGELSGTGTALGSGFLASTQHVPRRAWPANEGPAAPPCQWLSGPYQWLLPSSCSASTLQAQLESQLKLPPEAASAIVAQRASVDATTVMSWYVTGQAQRITSADGSRLDYERDVDGRILTEKLFNTGGALHSSADTAYDTLMRPSEVVRRDALGQSLGSQLQVWDEEGQLLYQCAEDVAGSCARASHGALPGSGTSSTHWYSPGGFLKKTQDAEGATVEYFRDSRKWVTRTASKAPSEVTRGTIITFDDDGQVLTTLYGQEFVGLLSETRGYDGLGRLISLIDTEGRRFTVGNSRRELTARVDLVTGSTVLWRSHWHFDGLGRALREHTNGTQTREVRRRAGGQAFASREVGQRWKYSTTNAEGVSVFEVDEGGETMTVRTAVPGSRVATASQLSKKGAALLTNSVVRTLDVRGDVVLQKEVGSGTGTGQAQLSRNTDFVRNASGFVSLERSADGAETENVYDFLGRLKLKKQLRTVGVPGFDQTQYRYDRRGALKYLEDPSLQVTTQEYTGFGEPKPRTSRGTPTVVSGWTYDVLGRVLTETTGGSSLTYEYDTVTGRLSTILGSAGVRTRDYGYDALGRLQSAVAYNPGLGFSGSPVPAASRPVSTTLGYDSLGRLSQETSKVGQRTQRVTGSTWTVGSAWQRQLARPDGTTSTEVFDTLGRLGSMNRPSGRATTWEYQGDFETRVSSNTQAVPLQRTTRYDALGQALEWNSSNGLPVQDISVLRDKLGRVGSYKRTVTRPSQPAEQQWRGFAYDALGRVSAAHEAAALPTVTAPTHTFSEANLTALSASAGATKWSYAREASVGNLLSITSTAVGAVPRFASPARGPGHQLSQYALGGGASRAVTHDSAGRLSRDGARDYVWDDFSALVAVTESGSVVEALQYDGLGRLVARWNSTQLDEELAYDGAQIAAAFGTTGAVKWRATWAPGIDVLLSVSDATGEYLALDDGKANVVGYFRADDSQLLGTASYTPEGRASWSDFRTPSTCVEEGATRCKGLLGFPFGFHSAYKSDRTGLIYFRNRWYSAEAGQWLSQDPLGYVDSFNAYAFNRFDPVNFVDPWGLATQHADSGRKHNFDPTDIDV